MLLKKKKKQYTHVFVYTRKYFNSMTLLLLLVKNDFIDFLA